MKLLQLKIYNVGKIHKLIVQNIYYGQIISGSLPDNNRCYWRQPCMATVLYTPGISDTIYNTSGTIYKCRDDEYLYPYAGLFGILSAEQSNSEYWELTSGKWYTDLNQISSIPSEFKITGNIVNQFDNTSGIVSTLNNIWRLNTDNTNITVRI